MEDGVQVSHCSCAKTIHALSRVEVFDLLHREATEWCLTQPGDQMEENTLCVPPPGLGANGGLDGLQPDRVQRPICCLQFSCLTPNLTPLVRTSLCRRLTARMSHTLSRHTVIV